MMVSPVASAQTEAKPAWAVDSLATPSSFSTHDSKRCEGNLGAQEPPCDGYLISVTNAGSIKTTEAPVVIKDELPPGLTVQRISLHWVGNSPESGFPLGNTIDLATLGMCTATPVEAAVVQCEIPAKLFGFLPLPVSPDDVLAMEVWVTVNEPAVAGPVTNKVSVEGGGTSTARSSISSEVESAMPDFGTSNFQFAIRGDDGMTDREAGGHPYEIATTIALNNGFRIPPDSGGAIGDTSIEDVKDVVVDLPLGFLGSALAAPTCTFAQLSSAISKGVGGCPSDTIVGHIRTFPSEKPDAVDGPIYNMKPEEGVAAELGFVDALAGSHVLYANVAPSPRGYVLRTIAREIPQIAMTHIAVNLFGDPALRDASGATPTAFFTNPSVCPETEEPLITTMHMDSWQHPGRFDGTGAPDFNDPRWVSATSSSPPIAGCNELTFKPQAYSFKPETNVADSPSGASFELQVPQSEDPKARATPPLKTAKLTLPQGLVVNPAAAGGLAACSPAQIGWSGPGVNDFTAARPACPDASKLGSVAVTSPLLPGTLTGSLYLATQNANPFASLLAAYLVIDDPTTGTVVKAPGRLQLDPGTGQITATFDEDPQLPFSDLKLHFFGGSRAELATPQNCGSFTTANALTPWSAPDTGIEPALLSDTFAITSGCTPGFAPSFTAGVASVNAGGFSPFTVSFSRQDSEQEIAGLSVHLPSGLVAKLAGVPLCPDAALAAAALRTGAAESASPSCPSGSKVGTVLAGAGVGPEPFFLSGQAYLTGPYKGAPYGLAVVVPLLAGPLDLGTLVVRQALYIDPKTVQVTDVSDPIPTVIDARGADGASDGFPVRLRRVDVTLDREGFTLNPTSCDPTAVGGTFTSSSGATAAASSRFQVGGCGELAFTPHFEVSVTGRTSRLNGAGLHVKLAYPAGSLGRQANIARVKVELPKQLPSRLGTLQKACLAATFEADPARCPSAAVVGHARVLTPLLASPLEGSAYFVSHGGEKFPDLTIILHGEGITIELVGSTFISKAGITSTTFKSPPDVPFSTFELTLPQGQFSALGANTNLCKAAKKLTMPTEFTAQNGAQLDQRTKITVTGCPKPARGHKPHKGRGRSRRGKKH
jgi:uncharacterized repeat protein (TIGR01451 family)